MGWNHLGVFVLGLCCAAHVVWGQGYVNIAPGKTYNQSSSLGSSYRASNVADGNTDSSPFFQTNNDNKSFWEVDLGRKYPVHNITVWSLNSGLSDRYLFPYTITVDGQHCVSVSSKSTSARNHSVTCSSIIYGQKVRITKTATGLSLAFSEFEILVPRGNSRCDEGRWGPLCQYNCDNNCGGAAGTNFCNQSTLNCYDDCVAGRWGDRCQKWCGQNCVTGNCDLTTGTCSVVPTRNFATSACIAGWYGDLCDTRCLSPSCLLHTCNQTTGRCLACDTGHDGDTCTECVEGFSKHNTATCSPCSAFCNTGGCDMVTGNCTKGCRPGVHGDQCEESCSTITSQCVQCTQSGECTACSGHFQPPQCTGCRPGYHGQQCNKSCSTITDQCDQCTQHGNCTICSGHFQPPECTACREGFYLRTEGADHCTECTWTCRNNIPCNHSTGDCDRCHAGWEGPRCLQRMKDESSQQSSVPVGSAILGAGLMLTVAVISVLVFLCWKHRSQKTLKDAETVAASSSDPVTASNNVYTAPPTASSSISPSASAQAGDVTPHVIRDPGNTYEQLRIYSNMVFDREAHSEPEPRGTDATTALSTSEHVHVSVEHVYANTSSATKERKPRKKKAN